MRHALLVFACATLGSACYSGARAARDLNPRWHGRARVELEARLGVPAVAQPQPDGSTLLSWTRTGRTVTRLPSGSFDLTLTPTSVDLNAELSPGEVREWEYQLASALVDQQGLVLRLDSGLIVGGIPRGRNLRTGAIFGLHGGMSALSDATTPLPSAGVYFGGMLGPRFALIGSYNFANAKHEGDYLNGHAWGFAAQVWLAPRVAVYAGPALVLDLDPGPRELELGGGVVSGLSLAVVRSGSFVLDLRLDGTLSTAGAIAIGGVGVNVN